MSGFHTVMGASVSYFPGCQGFILSWVPVFHIVMGASVSYCPGCQGFSLSWLSVFHTVMAVSVLYRPGCQGFILSFLSDNLLVKYSLFRYNNIFKCRGKAKNSRFV